MQDTEDAKTGHNSTVLQGGSLQVWPFLMVLFSKIVEFQSQALMFQHISITDLVYLDQVLYALGDVDQIDSSVWIGLLLFH